MPPSVDFKGFTLLVRFSFFLQWVRSSSIYVYTLLVWPQISCDPVDELRIVLTEVVTEPISKHLVK
jgi:hypothetical protein